MKSEEFIPGDLYCVHQPAHGDPDADVFGEKIIVVMFLGFTDQNQQEVKVLYEDKILYGQRHLFWKAENGTQ